MAVQQRPFANLLQRQLQTSCIRLTRQELLEGQREAGKALRPLALHHRRHFVAEAEQAAWLEADHRHTARDERFERRQRALGLDARFVDLADGEEGASAAQRTG